MAPKSSLKKEMSSMNKELEKYLKQAKIDSISEELLKESTSTHPSTELYLISEALKDIRLEMNLMRKHLVSDVGELIKSTLFDHHKQIKQELTQFYQQSFEIFKRFDPSVLKQVIEEVQHLSDQQNTFKDFLSTYTLDVDAKLQELSKKFDHLELFHEKEFSSFAKDLNSFSKEIQKQFSSFMSTLESQQKLRKKDLEYFEKSYTQLIHSIEKKYQYAEKSLTSSLHSLAQNPQPSHSSQSLPLSESISKEEVEILSPFPSERRIEKLLDIDERIKKLSSLK
jgi:Sec-independent protein translocase protein TatA